MRMYIPALPVMIWLSAGGLVNLSKLQCLHFKGRDNNRIHHVVKIK